eukprot:TRINITY_DN14331_c0_g1_i5.p1 TRINITY_DN14331_c0_g1~~TRINITY_DN14331_c0_g1_i5.p1  ORF type:complete len:206 (-),score=56.15 TRINITY_DN14331_c0_g1_i5:95-712(-)
MQRGLVGSEMCIRDRRRVHGTIDGKRLKLVLWDTAGQEQYRTLTSSYYKGSNGFIFVYDVTSEESFDNLDSWLKEVQENISEGYVQLMLIANKIDKEGRKVSKEDGENYARENSMLYIETSAKENIGIVHAIEEEVMKILDNNPKLTSGTTGTRIEKISPDQSSAKGCCQVFLSPTFNLSLIHISEPTRPLYISYAVFCLKKKKN